MIKPAPKTVAEAEPTSVRAARQAGRVVQAVLLAVLLSLAVMKLLVYAGASVVFRYQGF